ncbi:type II toxin-antitoxin system ParD family antitoxin [uncultured Paracoccus sp.]|uniref:ribbon-helix-helix domain-containing protein n=1 Tax=uncultured Paracoccus sp. TaxID=189685 RepID=UPI00261331FB|nr:type II toxin-antitoxin system ParD family antitoxin [uncultured Paracoccus sp.]
MSVKASVSITDQQDDYARSLVAAGEYASLSAVVQRGLELLRAETERERAELAALRAFFEERANGPFISAQESRDRTEAMIARKRAAHGL